MNVLIVIPHSNYVPSLPLGPLSIASYLKTHGHCVRICDCLLDPKAYKSHIQSGELPDLLAISLMSSSGMSQARQITELFREKGVPSVWGGGFTTAYYDFILENDCTDYISIGDGELSLTHLADALEGKRALSEVSGLVYRENGQTIVNKVVSLPASELPRLDFTLIDPKYYSQPLFCAKKMLHLYLSKGCPFNCTFCNRKLIGDSKYRARNMEDVIAEIRYLVTKCGCDGIYFYDELWCINQETALQFCKMLEKEKLDFCFGIYARIGQYDRVGLERLYAVGCRWILFGIESGSKEMREKLNKFLDEDKIYETFEICHELGIVTQASFIVGLPGETEADLKKTVDLAFGIHADLLPFSNYTPIRGSVLYNDLLNAGKLKEEKDINALEKKTFPTEKIVHNYSEVPTKELNVVRAFFRWCGFSNFDNNLSRFEIPKEMAKRYITIMFPKGRLNISGVNDSMTVLFDILFNVFLHPRIRKKYGLYKKNFSYRGSASNPAAKPES